MPNTPAGSYQPFGTGWNNLSNYLTRSNLGAINEEKAGAVNAQRYLNPDAGSSFDDWLYDVGKSRTPVKSEANEGPDQTTTEPPPLNTDGSSSEQLPEEEEPRNPARDMAERKRSWQEERERNDNPYSRFNGYY